MKRLVNGVETELSDKPFAVMKAGDQLSIRSSDGVHTAMVLRHGDVTWVSYRGRQYRVEPVRHTHKESGVSASGELRAPMPGLVVEVKAEPGKGVAKGDVLVVLEAMKTQQPFAAPFDGVVQQVSVAVGNTVSEGDILALVVPLAEDLNRGGQ